MRVAIVTGAAQGIGRRVAQTLAERGHDLALNDLRSPSETVAMVQQSGAAAIELVGDISDENCVTTFAEMVKAKWGRVDLLVNNAGISCIVPAEQTSGAQFPPRARSEPCRFFSSGKGVRGNHACSALRQYREYRFDRRNRRYR